MTDPLAAALNRDLATLMVAIAVKTDKEFGHISAGPPLAPGEIVFYSAPSRAWLQHVHRAVYDAFTQPFTQEFPTMKPNPSLADLKAQRQITEEQIADLRDDISESQDRVWTLENRFQDLHKLIGTIEAEAAAAKERAGLVHFARMRRRCDDMEGVLLVGGYVQQTYAKGADCPKSVYTVVQADGHGSSFLTADTLLGYWTLA